MINLPGANARNHGPRSHGLDEQEKWHDRQHVVMRRKGHEPVHNQVVGPHKQDKDVDGKNPQHQKEDRIREIGKIEMGRGFLWLSAESQNNATNTYRFSRMPLGPHTRSQLHDTCHHVGKLVRNGGRDENQQDRRVDQPPSCRGGRKDGEVANTISGRTRQERQTYPLSSRLMYPDLLFKRP